MAGNHERWTCSGGRRPSTTAGSTSIKAGAEAATGGSLRVRGSLERSIPIKTQEDLPRPLSDEEPGRGRPVCLLEVPAQAGSTVGGAQPTQRLAFDLARALAGNAERAADLFKCPALPIAQAIAQ